MTIAEPLALTDEIVVLRRATYGALVAAVEDARDARALPAAGLDAGARRDRQDPARRHRGPSGDRTLKAICRMDFARIPTRRAA